MMNHSSKKNSREVPIDLHQQVTNQLKQELYQIFAQHYQFSKIYINAKLLVHFDNSLENVFHFEDSVTKEEILKGSNSPKKHKTDVALHEKESQTDLIVRHEYTQTDEGEKRQKESIIQTRSVTKEVNFVSTEDRDEVDEENDIDVYNSDSESDTEKVVVLPAAVPTEDTSKTTQSKQEPVSCPLCSATFRTQSKVENHLRLKHDIGNVYICTYCEEICPSNTALHQHLEEKHNEKPVEIVTKKRGRKPSVRAVKKLTSGVPFKKSLNLTKAKKGNGPKKTGSKRRIPTLRLKMQNDQYVRQKYPCGECDKVYSSRKALKRHDLSAHKKNKYSCDKCSKSFCSNESLYHHRRGIHAGDKPYTCEECGSSFNFSHSLKLHLLKHSGKRPFQCKECDKTYLTANHLKMHMIGVHQNNKIHICKFCGKSFAYKTSLKVHEMTHENIKPYKCKICDKGFVNSHSLKYHTESTHETDKWFTCNICQKQFKTEFSMKTHRRRHSMDGNRFMCDVCGRQFMYKSTLEIHTAIHKDEKTYMCSTCGKSFKTYATLYSHQYVHRTESPYPCPECGKPFKTKERCKAHQRRHAGTKSFSCDVCGNLFQDKGGLSKHKRTVHAEFKRFACPVCGKTCSRADNLRVHMKIHGKLTQNAEPLDTTTSIEEQVEKATYTAVAQEINKHTKSSIEESTSSESVVPAPHAPSPRADNFTAQPCPREVSSSSPTLTPLASSRPYPEHPHYSNISPVPNLNVPLALTSMASSHMHQTDASDVQTAHTGNVTQIPNPSPFMYMWPYMNSSHQNLQNAPHEHEYFGQ